MENNSRNPFVSSPVKCLTPAMLAIAEECDQLKQFLLEKNRRYGNSALQPLRVFSGSSADEQINVRLDDKLSRIRNARETGEADIEDAELDLIGYLILKRVQRRLG